MSTPKCLTFIGTASIQQYVFQSNRLKENLGASQLVSSSVNHWETPKNSAWEVVFVGGGNAAVIFSAAPGRSAVQVARDAVTDWSTLMHRSAPGLRVVAAHEEFEPGRLIDAFSPVREKLSEVENRAPLGASLGALPFARQCNSTGVAAEELFDQAWISLEAASKCRAAGKANEILQKQFAGGGDGQFNSFPVQIADLGFTAGQKHIAIVHADGNGIGKLFGEIPKNATNDEAVIAHFKALSKRITNLATDAFGWVLGRLTLNAETIKVQPGFALTNFFPLRPIVYGGDDLTFVCHGRLGLTLAVAYLKAFEGLSRGLGLTACAGVAIIPDAFPFARGYDLAENLCASAKRARTEVCDGSWLDFEIVRAGAEPDLGWSREANYVRGRADSLLMRPYLLDNGDHERTWHRFEKNWAEVSGPKLPRSQAKGLQDAIRGEREDEAINFLKSRGHIFEDPWLLVNEGTIKRRCTLFDPLDALDFYLPLV